MTAREINIPHTGDATVPPGIDIARARSRSANDHVKVLKNSTTRAAYNMKDTRKSIFRQETNPRRKPWATACARSRTPSLRNSRRAWVFTVSSER